MVVEMGYRVTPVYASGSTKPFANGQTYTDLSDYKDAVHIGVVLSQVGVQALPHSFQTMPFKQDLFSCILFFDEQQGFPCALLLDLLLNALLTKRLLLPMPEPTT